MAEFYIENISNDPLHTYIKNQFLVTANVAREELNLKNEKGKNYVFSQELQSFNK